MLSSPPAATASRTSSLAAGSSSGFPFPEEGQGSQLPHQNRSPRRRAPGARAGLRGQGPAPEEGMDGAARVGVDKLSRLEGERILAGKHAFLEAEGELEGVDALPVLQPRCPGEVAGGQAALLEGKLVERGGCAPGQVPDLAGIGPLENIAVETKGPR